MKLTTLSYLPFMALFFSCSPIFYSPSGQNVPLLEDKGEFVASAGYATAPGENADGFFVQSAYAVSDDVGVIGSHHRVASGILDDWDVVGNYIEFGIGKFNGIGESKWRIESYYGLGLGGFKNESVNDSRWYNTKFMKLFIQPSIGYVSSNFEAVFTPKFVLNSYTSNEGFLTGEDLTEANRFFDEKGTTFIIEPGLTLRGGFENIKLQAQYVYSTFDFESSQANPIQKEYFSIGIIARIAKKDPSNEN